MTSDDGRIPVRLIRAAGASEPGAESGPGAETTLVVVDARVARPTAREHEIVDFGAGAGSHATGCACCFGRPPLATALGRLFGRRARGEIAFFDAVLAVSDAAGLAAARAALAADPFLLARYRLVEPATAATPAA